MSVLQVLHIPDERLRKVAKPVKAGDFHSQTSKWRPLGDSNPCYRRERAVSWASRRRGRISLLRKTPCFSLSIRQSV